MRWCRAVRKRSDQRGRILSSDFRILRKQMPVQFLTASLRWRCHRALRAEFARWSGRFCLEGCVAPTRRMRSLLRRIVEGGGSAWPSPGRPIWILPAGRAGSLCPPPRFRVVPRIRRRPGDPAWQARSGPNRSTARFRQGRFHGHGENGSRQLRSRFTPTDPLQKRCEASRFPKPTPRRSHPWRQDCFFPMAVFAATPWRSWIHLRG